MATAMEGRCKQLAGNHWVGQRSRTEEDKLSYSEVEFVQDSHFRPERLVEVGKGEENKSKY